MGLCKRGARRALQQVPCRLHGVESADLERALDRLGLFGARHRDTDRDAARLQACEVLEHRRIVEHAAVQRGGVDLVQAEIRPEQLPALSELAA